jgi:hypothetical protein
LIYGEFQELTCSGDSETWILNSSWVQKRIFDVVSRHQLVEEMLDTFKGLAMLDVMLVQQASRHDVFCCVKQWLADAEFCGWLGKCKCKFVVYESCCIAYAKVKHLSWSCLLG